MKKIFKLSLALIGITISTISVSTSLSANSNAKNHEEISAPGSCIGSRNVICGYDGSMQVRGTWHN